MGRAQAALVEAFSPLRPAPLLVQRLQQASAGGPMIESLRSVLGFVAFACFVSCAGGGDGELEALELAAASEAISIDVSGAEGETTAAVDDEPLDESALGQSALDDEGAGAERLTPSGSRCFTSADCRGGHCSTDDGICQRYPCPPGRLCPALCAGECIMDIPIPKLCGCAPGRLCRPRPCPWD
jgi:hypothetical protein